MTFPAATIRRAVAPRMPGRTGLSLLEVVLAIAILGVAISVIGELVRLGSRCAAEARDLTTAQLYCESKMAEIAAGADVAQPVTSTPIDTVGEWMYYVEVAPTDQVGLILITVTVEQNRSPADRPVSFTLQRWIQDPNVVYEEDESTMPADTTGESSG